MKRALAFAIIQVVLRAIQLLPIAMIHRMGHGLGWAIFKWPSHKHAIIQDNLETAFPDLNAIEHEALKRDNAYHMACFALEAGLVWHANLKKLNQIITEVHGWEHIDTAQAKGQSVLLVGAHLGNWEILNLYCMDRLKMAALYKAPKDAHLDQWVRVARERFGGKLIPSGSQAMRVLLKTLKSGGIAGIIADQQPRQGEGVMAPFFKTPALTMTLVGRLAQRTHCVVLMAQCYRMPGQGFSIEISPMDAAITDPDPMVAATALNHALETAIRKHPEQYLWRYPRFS